MALPVLMLLISNLFMTVAWYGHLKNLTGKPLWLVVLICWAIAFFEYCFQVPGNRWGYAYYTLPQLKVMQEIITMVVFAGFSVWYMNVPLTKNYLLAGACLVGAAYFIFTDVK